MSTHILKNDLLINIFFNILDRSFLKTEFVINLNQIYDYKSGILE